MVSTVMRNKVYLVGRVLIDESIQITYVLSFQITCSGFPPTVRKCFDFLSLTLYKIRMSLIE